MRQQKLSHTTKFAYWVGQLAEGLKNTTFGLFLLFFYNQILGLSGTLCGLALLIAILIDAVTDPLMGSISDGWRSRWGRRHPFMYAAAVPMAVCFYLLFNPLPSSELGLFVWLLIFSSFTRISMTLYSVPHMALGAEMTNDYHERTTVVAGRSLFGVLGGLLVYLLGFGVFFAANEAFPNGQLNVAAYPKFSAVIAGLILLSIVATAWGTHHLIPTLAKPTGAMGRGLRQAFVDTVAAARNTSFRWLVSGFMLSSIPAGIGLALALYLKTFFWELAPDQMTYVLAASPLGTVIGYLLATGIGQLIEKKQALMWGSTCWVVFTIGPVCLHYAGLFPAPGSLGVVVGLAFCAFLAGLTVAPASVAVGSMLADVADEQELITDKRQEGVFYGGFAFVTKAAGGFGAAFGGVTLDLIRWPTDAGIRTAADVPPDVLFKLAMIAGPGLAIGLIPALWCFNHYTLDHRRLASIHAEIGARTS